MNILLINPSAIEDKKSWLNRWSVHPPLGLCYLAAVAEKKGHKVKIIDNEVSMLNYESLENEISGFKPDVVGLTGTSSKHNVIASYAKFIRGVCSARIVLGGPHVSIMPDKVMEDMPDVDFLVVGEGEYTFLELVNALEEGADLRKISSLVFRDGDKLIMNAKRGFVQDLDELPFPARHLLPDLKLYKPEFGYKRQPVTSMITSRGCPFRCTFCCKVFGNVYRHHSAEYIVSEIKHLVNEYGIREIDFVDDLFLLDINHVKKLCDLMEAEGVDVTWRCCGRINVLSGNLDILPKLKKAGCWYISFGLESGNQSVLNSINKDITLEQVREVIKCTHKAGIFTKGYFMIGHPSDTKETINDTVDFAASLDLDAANFNLVYPFHGTLLYAQALESGSFDKDDFESLYGETDSPPYIPKNLTKEFLKAAQKRAYRRFYLNPMYILRQIGNIHDLSTLNKYFSVGVRYVAKLVR